MLPKRVRQSAHTPGCVLIGVILDSRTPRGALQVHHFLPQDPLNDLFSKTALCQTCSDMLGAHYTIDDQVHGVSGQFSCPDKGV